MTRHPAFRTAVESLEGKALLSAVVPISTHPSIAAVHPVARVAKPDNDEVIITRFSGTASLRIANSHDVPWFVTIAVGRVGGDLGPVVLTNPRVPGFAVFSTFHDNDNAWATYLADSSGHINEFIDVVLRHHGVVAKTGSPIKPGEIGTFRATGGNLQVLKDGELLVVVSGQTRYKNVAHEDWGYAFRLQPASNVPGSCASLNIHALVKDIDQYRADDRRHGSDWVHRLEANKRRILGELARGHCKGQGTIPFAVAIDYLETVAGTIDHATGKARAAASQQLVEVAGAIAPD